jgi:RNA polymerase sigma factor (sigma-70 family)
MENHSINPLVDHLFRHESGKMVSVLTKILGINNLEVAQDIVQETLLTAMSAWKFGRMPQNPSAWLYCVAKNKAIDFLRHEKTVRENQSKWLIETQLQEKAGQPDAFDKEEIQDSQLRMIFACCHPEIPEDSQLAFALKTLCGLSCKEIASAFLTNEETIAKRIYRAKEKIRSENISLEIPVAELAVRLDTVLHVLYLLFNEGYNSSHHNQLIREDLCEEAVRLCYMLTLSAKTNSPATNALLALFCFQSSRLHSRIDESGSIITLKYQDRSTWNRHLIKRGMDYLDVASTGAEVTVYHLEAAIASVHASAPSFAATNWKMVYELYEILYQRKPSPVIAMNKAIASCYAIDGQTALAALHQIKGLENHYLFHATLGEVCLDLDKKQDAKKHFAQALTLTSSQTEQKLLQDKLSRCN